jgi:iron complex outermembrane receptor protein
VTLNDVTHLRGQAFIINNALQCECDRFAFAFVIERPIVAARAAEPSGLRRSIRNRHDAIPLRCCLDFMKHSAFTHALGLACAAVTSVLTPPAQAQTAPPPDRETTQTLGAVVVNASADASAEGLPPTYAGGQVARGGRVGLFGNQDVMDTPFNTTSYTQDLIRDQQAQSVGDVLRNAPSVRVARGFGNFQESYFIRGFLLNSDNVAYNGLYSLLPRQYIATELFERVELLRGASAFLNGASPSGDGIGGSINLLPKRAPNEPSNRITAGIASGGQTLLSADLARRFGPDGNTGIRVNVARRDGDTAVDQEASTLSLASVGLDWRSSRARLSADIGHQNHKLQRTRTNVTLNSAVTEVPHPAGSTANWAQPWAYSNEKDTFGTLRGELDLNDQVTVYGAYGLRRSDEANSLANLTITNGATGAGTTSRFDNTRKDKVDTGEAGIRARLKTGPVGHTLVASVSRFSLDVSNAYALSSGTLATNLHAPVSHAVPALAFLGNALANPARSRATTLTSLAVGDTLSMLGDDLRITLGLRQQKLATENWAYNTGVRGQGYDNSHLSPMAAVLYRLRKNVSVYANYAESLSQGETAPSTASNLGEQLSPYVSKQKEVGIKVDQGGYGATAALFHTVRPRGFVGSDNVFREAGSDRHQGIELTVYGQLTRGMRAIGGVMLIDAEQRATGSTSTEGRQVIGVAKAQANLGLEWDVPGVRGLSLDGRLQATRGVYANATNTLRVPGWGVIDVGARYLTDIAGKAVTLRLRVDNVADRAYWASSGGYAGAGYLVQGQPRTVVMSVSVDL